jgi:hypothetical protein
MDASSYPVVAGAAVQWIVATPPRWRENPDANAVEAIDPSHVTGPRHPPPISRDVVFACWSWVPSAAAIALIQGATANGTDLRHINWNEFMVGLSAGLVGVLAACTGLVFALPDAGTKRPHRDRRYAQLALFVNTAALMALASIPFVYFGYRF